MNPITLRQNGNTFALNNLEFHPAEDFEEEGTWYVTDESLLAELGEGPEPEPGTAELIANGQSIPVNIALVYFAEDEEGEEADGSAEEIAFVEISSEEISSSDLARQLGLLQ